MSEQKKAEAPLRYVHPPGERFFSIGVLACTCFLGAVQIALIPLFAKEGLGYEYLVSCMIAAHIYIYIRSWRLTRNNRKEPVDLYSLISGYIIITGVLFILPLVLVAGGAMSGAGETVSEVFVENNRDLLEIVLSLDLPGTRPPLDWKVHKNAVNLYYMTLAMLVGMLGFVLGAPLIWLKAHGWSDFMDVNPHKFGFSQKLYSVVLGIAICIYVINANIRQLSYGHNLLPNGSFSAFDGWDWNRSVIAWSVSSALCPILFALTIGALLNMIRNKEGRNV